MRSPISNKRKSRLLIPLFCSISTLVAAQAFAGTPTVSLNADAERGNIAESGRLGYVGGSTRVGVSIDKNLQGQVDVNQIVAEDDLSATSVEGWFGYQLKDKNAATKGVKGAGVKLNHLWVERGGKYQGDTVHKVFGAYDKNADDHAKITAGYGQEQRDLFWSGHVSKGISGKSVIGTTSTSQTSTKAYDYGVGGEVGTFLEDSLTRIRGGVDYEWGTDYSGTEDKPTQATISAGVQQYFYDSPHSVTFDVSASKKAGGSTAKTTSNNARVGYQYEFGKAGTFQSNRMTKRTRVEVPGTAAIAAVPAIAGKPAKYTKKAINTPYTKLVKTTMKLENETFFKLNSAQLTASAKRNLNKIAAEIRRNSYTGAIRITGNTCGLGNAKYDQLLSERRAKAVKQFMIRAGFNSAHLVARGLGKDHPKYPNDPASGFKNRRVDIEYVSQRSVKKKAYKTQYKNILVSAGTPSRPGRAGVAATPARFIWKTEEIKSAPIWVKRALHNPIRHKRSVDTYQTQASLNAVNDEYTLTNRNEIILDVLGNDAVGLTDLIIVTPPIHGTAVVENGKIKYTPDANFAGGIDQFTYQVKDADGNTSEATVTITVPTAQNVAPVGVDDTITTSVGTPATIDVIANDTDADNSDTLSLLNIITDPAHGTVVIAGNEVTYTPDSNFEGVDQFTYTVSDGQGHTDTATVNIVVSNNGTNSAPDAVNDSFVTAINTPKTYSVLANDNDPDGDTLTISATTNPAHGVVTISNSQIIYTPTTGYTGSDSFTYTITDGQGNEDTATVSVTITDTTDGAPVLSPNYAATYGDMPVTIRVLDDDTDPDGDTLVLTGNLTDPTHGSAIISGNNVIYTATVGYIGSDSFEYEVTDNNGHTLRATVYIDVKQPVNNAAPDAALDNATLDLSQYSSITINVLANDSDADGDTLTIETVSSPIHGNAVITNGEIVYTPNSGFEGYDSFTYTISDGNGNTSVGNVNVSVTGANPHVGAGDDYISTPQDTPKSYNIIANDSDIDNHALSICTGSMSTNHGAVVVSGQSITYTPDNGYTGNDQFEYEACDGNGNSDWATVFITVDGSANQAPNLVGDNYSVESGSTTELDVLVNDSDPDGDTLTLTGVSVLPAHGQATISNGKVSYIANTGFTGADSFTYAVNDGFGHYTYATVSITITAASNTAPEISTITAFNVDLGVTTPLDLSSFISDVDGDTVYIASADALSGSLTFTGTTIQYEPKDVVSGDTDSIIITVSDGHGGTATATIIINMN